MKSKILVCLLITSILIFSISIYFVIQFVFIDSPIEQEEVKPVGLSKEISSDEGENETLEVPENTNPTKILPSEKIITKSNDESPSPLDNSKKELVLTQAKVESKVEKQKENRVEFAITIIDGETKNALIEYGVILKYKIKDDEIKEVNYITDKQGKLKFSTSKSDNIIFHIITKDYGIHSFGRRLVNGNNYYIASLFKGGAIELRVTNNENNVIEKLEAIVGKEKNWHEKPFAAPLVFNSANGTYLIENLPIGLQELSFKAPGYLESVIYKIPVEVNSKTTFEVKLTQARKITIDLDVKVKPNSINILNTKFNRERITYGADDNRRLVNELTQVFKNKNDMYEYYILEKTTGLSILADKYESKEFAVTFNQELYRITLNEGYSGKLQIIDESGYPIAGVKVNCLSGFVNQQFVSDKGGIVFLKGIINELAEISISEPNFTSITGSYKFKSKEINFYSITLSKFNSLSGKIIFDSKPVEDANVLLYFIGQTSPHLRTTSGIDGAYNFDRLEWKKDRSYYIKSNHINYGHGKSENFNYDEQDHIIDIELKAEKSFSLYAKFHTGLPLAKKDILLLSSEDNEFILNILTDDKGNYNCNNLIPGPYFFKYEDENYKTKNAIKVPMGKYTLNVQPRARKKINILFEGGRGFSGHLFAYTEGESNNLLPIDIIVDENKNYFLDITDNNYSKLGPFIFETKGYATCKLGAFKRIEDVPSEFSIEFKEGERLSVKVEDARNYNPISFTSVQLYNGKIRVQSLPTNDNGIVVFNNLIGKYTVKVKDDNFSAFSIDIDISQTKELLVKLIKGGGLKGKLTRGDDIISNTIYLRPGNNTIRLKEDGNFEFNNLPPGEYILSISKNYKNGKIKEDKIPGRILIENDKILELDLDSLQKQDKQKKETAY